MNYEEFLAQKLVTAPPTGLDVAADVINPQLFPFQRDIVRWALRRGRAAIFADCGLGKTPMQLEWARHVGDVLILTPLAVAEQTVREGKKFGVPVTSCSCSDDIGPGVNVANYEKLHRFDLARFRGVVLDESSILKNYDGHYRTELTAQCAAVPFRLCCTATPAPNDHMELANHVEFLGLMSRAEMLSMYFVHDGGDTSKWRLKGHAARDYWRWMASWAVMFGKPSDLGYEDGGFSLPPLEVKHHTLHISKPIRGSLFVAEARSLSERRSARKQTIGERCRAAATIVATEPGRPWVVWCNLNAESEGLARIIPGAAEVTGSMSDEQKCERLVGFASGRYRILVTKPKIGGFGLNWQHCSRQVFVGLSDSYEQYYQAVRRCWRFGQLRQVEVHIVTDEREGSVVKNIQRKEGDAASMSSSMVEAMSTASREELGSLERKRDTYATETRRGEGWTMHLGDCVEVLQGIEDQSIDYTIFSPPFSSLYTYSASARDLGNCRGDEDFAKHFGFLVPELLRVTKPGRLLSFHCMLIPSTLSRDGVIGLRDFRGDLIRIFTAAGWIHHSEVVIWKDPVTAMQRTKAIGLLWKQLRKDSAISRQGIPDYLITMRKPGVNASPVAHEREDYPVEKWQRIASPVWMDINPSRTLQKESAREEQDERHICPLQLDVIERAVELWSNPGDLVLSPFAGIGSEGYQSLKMARRFVGAELKRSYYEQACKNLKEAAQARKQRALFLEEAEESCCG